MAGPKKTAKPSMAHATQPKTAEQWQLFLDTLAETANATRSAEAAGMHRTTVYERRKNDPEFEKLYQEAYATGYDKMEEECQRRAFSGFQEPVFFKGEQVATVTRFSDSLAQFLLKGNKSDKFRDRIETIDGGNAGPSRFAKMTDEELEAELKRRQS